MKWHSKLMVAATFLALSPSSALAATYYVDPAGSDANPGTSQTAPWATLTKVSNVTLQPGDRVLLKGGGVFKSALTVKGGGSASAPATIDSYGSGDAIIDGAGTSAPTGITLTNGGSYVTVANIEVRNFSGDSENAIYTEGGSHYTFDNVNLHDNYSGIWNSSHGNPTPSVTITNSTISGLDNAGIDVNVGNLDSTGWQFTNDEITNTGDSCIIDWGGQDVYDNVRIHHCGFASQSAVPWYRHGIYAKGPNITVKNSTVWDINTSGYGGQCLSMREGGLVENNVLHGCTGGVGFFDYTRGATQTLTIRRNRIWDFKAWGIYLDPVGTNGENPYNVKGHSETFNINNNTIVSTSGANDELAFAGAYAGYTANINTDNNVLVANHNGDVALTAWESLGYPGTTHYSGSHNMIWSTSGSAYVKVKGNMSTNPTSVPGETGSSNENPDLTSVAPTSPDLSLKDASPAVNYGVANTPGGSMAPTCDGTVLSYCGSAPDNGALETGVSGSGGGPGETAPTIAVTSAPSDSTSTSASVAWTTTGTVTSTGCNLDGLAASCSSPASYSGLSTGTHTLKITVTNTAGSDTATVTWTVGTSGGGGSGDSDAPTAPTSLAGTTAVTTASLSWTAAHDNVGVAGYEVYVNGSLATKVTGTKVTVAGLKARSYYKFTVKAFDAAGNVSPATPTLQLHTHRIGWKGKVATQMNVSSTAATLELAPDVQGSIVVDGKGSKHVRGGKAVHIARLASHRWHRIDTRLHGRDAGRVGRVIVFRTLV